MASPGLELPPTSRTLTDVSVSQEMKETEQQRGTTQWAEDLEGKDPRRWSPETLEITYHYLTFDTELPSPTKLPPRQGATNPPEPPDLTRYISPFLWSDSRKTIVLWLSCITTVVTAYCAGSYSSAAPQLSRYWDVSQTAILVGITTFTTGFSIAPMVLAPFSEINGRYPVFVVTGILFVVCQTCTAITRSFPGMLVARFFLGVRS